MAYGGVAEETGTLESLQEETKKVDRLLTTHQRVNNRMAFAKKPTALDLQLHMTKTLSSLHLTLRGILDVVHFGVGSPSSSCRYPLEKAFVNVYILGWAGPT